MDSLPPLHPIVLHKISSPPFEFSPRGLTFRGHARESLDDLKSWLFAKRKDGMAVDRKKEWWLAQLRLHGVAAKGRMTKKEAVNALKAALSEGGLTGPTQEILQLERKLERKFLLENGVAREEEYASLSEEERIVKYSERYLSEKFLSGTNDESVMVFWVHQGCCDGQKLHDAATKLGLHSANALGARERKLIIVGKNKVDVRKEVSDWEIEYSDWKKGEVAKS